MVQVFFYPPSLFLLLFILFRCRSLYLSRSAVHHNFWGRPKSKVLFRNFFDLDWRASSFKCGVNPKGFHEYLAGTQRDWKTLLPMMNFIVSTLNTRHIFSTICSLKGEAIIEYFGRWTKSGSAKPSLLAVSIREILHEVCEKSRYLYRALAVYAWATCSDHWPQNKM